MSKFVRETVKIGDKLVTLETGRMARQASGSCVVRMGDTMSLLAVAADQKPTDKDFLPLMVEYRDKTYAAGKIPGGFFKREGKPTEREILTARLIDRPLRPLFPKGYRNETQIIAFIISADTEFHADTLSITGASMALALSDVPFHEIVSGIRVADLDGEFVPNPSFEQLESSCMDLIVAGTDDIVCMIEGECLEVPEDRLLDAIEFAHGWIRKLNALQRELLQKAGGKTKWADPVVADTSANLAKVVEFVGGELKAAITVKGKHERADALDAAKAKVAAQFTTAEGKADPAMMEAFAKAEKKLMREMILTEGTRADGRNLTTVRPITIETGVLPRAHGSCLFTRGETQALGTVTLGSKQAEQRIEPLGGEQYWSKYYLHYNFPPFSVGETGRYSGTGRREIGHGKLAERAIRPILPELEDFPYTIRLVSDILESNGSSSMATVCACCLALMDAGAPIRKAVAGVAMGLVKEDDRIAVLTDILGVEDHLGDMDFKVTGTRDGITAFQLDTKIAGISRAVMNKALGDAKAARLHILAQDERSARSRPRVSELSKYAPRITTIKVKPDQIRVDHWLWRQDHQGHRRPDRRPGRTWKTTAPSTIASADAAKVAEGHRDHPRTSRRSRKSARQVQGHRASAWSPTARSSRSSPEQGRPPVTSPTSIGSAWRTCGRHHEPRRRGRSDDQRTSTATGSVQVSRVRRLLPEA
jgi:polyribonucleotide nucleotidyltransferase